MYSMYVSVQNAYCDTGEDCRLENRKYLYSILCIYKKRIWTDPYTVEEKISFTNINAENSIKVPKVGNQFFYCHLSLLALLKKAIAL